MQNITYTTIRSRRRSIGIEITMSGDVIVRMPLRAKEQLAAEFIRKKSPWIIKTIEKVRTYSEKYRPKQFLDGEEFTYLNMKYPLRYVESGAPTLQFRDGMFLLNRSKQGSASRQFISWYRKAVRTVLEERLLYFSQRAGLRYGRVTITAAKRRWGSCSHRNDLSFSWRLVLAPIEIVDYVVLHELVHVIEKNHSRDRFWAVVARYMPDYKERRNWLKKNGVSLDL